MRDIELNRMLEWRWASCVALVAGACAFVALALLAIPDRIGPAPSPASDSQLTAHAPTRETPPFSARRNTPASPAAREVPVATAQNAALPPAPAPAMDLDGEPETAVAVAPMPTSIPIGPVRPEDD